MSDLNPEQQAFFNSLPPWEVERLNKLVAEE